jgi:hypothetical protein
MVKKMAFMQPNRKGGRQRIKMKWFGIILFIALPLLVGVETSQAENRGVLFRDDFNNLENWRPVYFPKIKQHTVYSHETEGNQGYLKAESNATASALLYKGTFNVYDHPKVRWRWRVAKVYQKGDVRTKAGDDYPLRIYILFQYDPARATVFQQAAYVIAKSIYGEYPPHSALNYIWANREEEKGLLVINPYEKSAKMIALQGGASRAGQWLDEKVHIIEDYRRAFGSDPPPVASIGIMNDSDNTKESAVSFLDFIEVFR